MVSAPQGNVYVRNASQTAAAGEETFAEFYVEAGKKGIIVDVRHTSAGAGTMTYKIQTRNFNSGLSGFTESWTDLLTSAAIAKDTGARLTVGEGAPTTANISAPHYLGYKLRIRGDAGTADVTGIYIAVTQV